MYNYLKFIHTTEFQENIFTSGGGGRAPFLKNPVNVKNTKRKIKTL